LIMSEKVYGVGIAGFGFIGKVHSYGYINMPLFYDPVPVKTKLVGVCTSRNETAEKAKQQVGFEFCTTEFRELIEHPEIDIINICSPNYLHKDQLIAAIKADKFIYCDKPVTSSYSDAEEVLGVIDETGYSKTNQMTLQNRFFPATIRAKQLMDEEFPGEINSFRACYLHSGNLDRNKPMSWKIDKERNGGGVLFDLGSHILDLLFHLMGEPREVFAETSIIVKQRPGETDPTKLVDVESDDLAIMMLKMKNGAIGTVEASKVAMGVNDELRFEIHGDKGAICFNLMEPNWLEVYDSRDDANPIGGMRGFRRIECVQRYPKPAAAFPGPKFSVGWIRSHMACLHNFLVGVAEDKPASPSLADGIRLQNIMQTAYESADKRQWMKL
jgi:levoglucosan dehydrogenase